jgi:cytochrome b
MGDPVTEQADPEPPVAVRLWDMPVRFFHWAMLVLVVVQAFTGWRGGELMAWHVVSGYALLVLVVFRILWGFVGSTPARFASFIAGPVATFRFARRLFSREAVPQLGHNPLGGWSVILMLAALAIQGGTGLYANDGVVTEGPLARLVSIETSNLLTEIHRWSFRVLAVLAGLHVAAVAYHALFKKDDVMTPMFTGVKHVPASFLRERRVARRDAPLRRAASREIGHFYFPRWQRAIVTFGAALALVLLVV